jgi:hypothetical protein
MIQPEFQERLGDIGRARASVRSQRGVSLLVPPRLVMMHPRHDYHTRWGEGFALWQREVKHFFLDNARMYLREDKADCLRFDAVHAIQSDAVSFIVQTLRREFPDKYLIAEYNPSDTTTSASGLADPYGYLGFCTIWDMNCADDTFAQV